MKPTYPLEKSKSMIGLSAHGKPALVASDASRIRFDKWSLPHGKWTLDTYSVYLRASMKQI